MCYCVFIAMPWSYLIMSKLGTHMNIKESHSMQAGQRHRVKIYMHQFNGPGLNV